LVSQQLSKQYVYKIPLRHGIVFARKLVAGRAKLLQVEQESFKKEATVVNYHD